MAGDTDKIRELLKQARNNARQEEKKGANGNPFAMIVKLAKKINKPYDQMDPKKLKDIANELEELVKSQEERKQQRQQELDKQRELDRQQDQQLQQDQPSQPLENDLEDLQPKPTSDDEAKRLKDLEDKKLQEDLEKSKDDEEEKKRKHEREEEENKERRSDSSNDSEDELSSNDGALADSEYEPANDSMTPDASNPPQVMQEAAEKAAEEAAEKAAEEAAEKVMELAMA
ncbi:hypothetical protein L3V82_11695 [Thiotrichales bacterium 19S3-7]|nr:hypothetical protein [Thiotrichales bacterium 19S3-7]MCF6802876.1 hypothetical protein [Thiotrichales bacterium 19S3-11]